MITVIADDITGAAEIAGVCLRFGLKVTLGIDSVPDVRADVCVISTDSRSDTEIEAYHIHHKLATEVFNNPDSIVFKKCDSVLRGYVLTELSAILDVKKFKTIVLKPANPLSGRCIRNGTYFIGSEKIEDTDFAKDPDFPATVSEVQHLLLNRSANYNLITDIHTGTIHEFKKEGLFVPDCSTVEELSIGCNLGDDDTFMCGSAAFFGQLLLKSGIARIKKDQTLPTFAQDYLIVSGTTHSASRNVGNQPNKIKTQVVAFPESLLREKTENIEIEKWVEELHIIWKRNRKMILTISENKISFPDSTTILKQRMGLIVQQLVEKCEIKELFIEGGATTYSILNILNWKTLIPVQELSPGVVRMEVPDFPSIHLTIKPGSYSWPESVKALF